MFHYFVTLLIWNYLGGKFSEVGRDIMAGIIWRYSGNRWEYGSGESNGSHGGIIFLAVKWNLPAHSAVFLTTCLQILPIFRSFSASLALFVLLIF